MAVEKKAPLGKFRIVKVDSLDDHIDRYDFYGDYSDRSRAIELAKENNEDSDDWIAYLVFDDQGKMICGTAGEIS